MEIDLQDYLRTREISFAELHPQQDQCAFAHQLLTGIDGVQLVSLHGPLTLSITYDLTRISLRTIEDALHELGFHLQNSLLIKLRRALIYYTEETALQNLDGHDHNAMTTREIFINRYDRLCHGCRDTRPGFWRRYS